MTFLSKNTTPIFFKIKKLNDELDLYERKIRMLQNEFAGNLKQDEAARLLDWISINRLRMRN